MYRLEMENQQQQASASECGFGKKIWSFPMVRSAADLALSVYSRAKDYNSVSKTTFSKAEQTVAAVATYAKPLLVKIETPLTVADQLACSALVKLEEKVPAVAMTPEDIGTKAKQAWDSALKPARDGYNNALLYGTQKLDSVKVYGLAKAQTALETPLGKKVASSVDELLIWADKNVDSRFPASQSEGEVKPVSGSVIDKAAILSTKISRRLRKRTDDRIVALKTYFMEIYAKSDVPNQVLAVRKRMDATKIAIATKTSQVLDAASPAELKQQAYKLTAYAKDSYTKLKDVQLPQGFQVAVTATKSYADKLYTPINEAKTWNEVSSAVTKNLAVVAADLKMATIHAVQLLRSSATPVANTNASEAPHHSQ